MGFIALHPETKSQRYAVAGAGAAHNDKKL